LSFDVNIFAFFWLGNSFGYFFKKGAISPIFLGQSYKTFYARNLQIFKTSQSVCPWQAFPA